MSMTIKKRLEQRRLVEFLMWMHRMQTALPPAR